MLDGISVKLTHTAFGPCDPFLFNEKQGPYFQSIVFLCHHHHRVPISIRHRLPTGHPSFPE